jgi:ABC-type phosphate transport system substrate-binding protein
VVFLIVLATIAGTGAPAFASASISGGGSGFAALEIDQWRADVHRSPFNLNVDYVAQGSSFGRSQWNNGSFDYGASDIPFPPLEVSDVQHGRCAGKSFSNCFVYVPVSAGGLAFMYNLKPTGSQMHNLRLTRRAACKIFTGAITRWNDPEIVATNPSLASYNHTIVPVIRSDGAGESYVFSQFCIAVAPDIWNAFIQGELAHFPSEVAADFRAGQPVSNWPQHWVTGTPNAQAFADGVANTVADSSTGRDAITYVAAGYAKVRNNFPTASVQNAAGIYTQPDETNVTVALGYATPRGDGTFNLNFKGPDPRAYYPSTYSYVIAQTTGFNAAKGATLGTFLCYAVSQGQVYAPSLRYARLSAALVKISIDAIVRIPGAPKTYSSCFIGNTPPPAAPQVLGGTAAGAGGLAGAAGTTSAAQAAAAAAAARRAAAARAAAGDSGTGGDTGGNGQLNLAGATPTGATSGGAARPSDLVAALAGAILCALIVELNRRRKASA